MCPDPGDLVDAIAAAIRAHLETHPLAADSVSGVAQWWLGPSHASAALDQVEQALELLVRRQQLRRVTLSDGTVLYSHSPPVRQ
jgi:hypothetical protein